MRFGAVGFSIVISLVAFMGCRDVSNNDVQDKKSNTINAELTASTESAESTEEESVAMPRMISKPNDINRVVSFNLDRRLGRKFDEILAILKAVNPDILCLQEVNNWQDVERLAKELGLNASIDAWHPTAEMTVLSRNKISETVNIEMPNTYYNALVGIRVSDVWIYSIHLSSEDYKEDEALRLEETQFILSKLSPTGRIILAGDFNSISHLDEINGPVINLPSHLFEKAGFADVQAMRSWTRGTWMPSLEIERIDRIYARGFSNYRQDTQQEGIVDHLDLGISSWPTDQDHRLIWWDTANL